MIRLFVFFAAVILSGCSQLDPRGNQEGDGLGLRALQESMSCCGAYDQFPFVPLDEVVEKSVLIDLKAPSYDFATGKSFFAAFELLQTNYPLEINIISAAEESVFVPFLTVLGEDFSDLTNIYPPQIILEGRSISHPQRYVLTITVNSNETHKAKYIVLHTTKNSIETHTLRDLPKDVVAQTGQTMANSKMLLNSDIEHSAIGKIEMSVIGVTSTQLAKESVLGQSDNDSISATNIEKLQTSLTQAEKRNYGLEIIEAVKKGELNEAMRYVMNAQDTDLAQSIFTRAIKAMP